MKKFTLIFGLINIISCSLHAQTAWDGAWEGKIEIANLRLVLNIKTAQNGTISATMDSPDQSAFGIPVEKASIHNDSLLITDSKYGIAYSGKRINDSVINGVFTQGTDLPLILKRTSSAIASRPAIKKQTPVPPFPYKVEEVIIENKQAGVTLSGTLTIPEGTNGNAYPAVVLVSGSGPQDRDETILTHKPFAVLADHLTRQGVMVLRYDDRGTGKSTGDFASSTSLDFAGDAAAAVEFLSKRKEADKKRLGIIGHSEGGLIAPIVANENKEVDFIVLLAGPGVPVVQLMAEQNIAVIKSHGIDAETANEYGKLYKNIILIGLKDVPAEQKTNEMIQIAEQWGKDQPEERLKRLGLMGDKWPGNYAAEMVKETSGKWMQYFLNYDPRPALQNLKVKVLALNGDKDAQVLAESNLAAIETALKKSKSPSYKTISLKGLNHLFQTCNTCSVAEYGTIEETFSPYALNEITTWLKEESILKK